MLGSAAIRAGDAVDGAADPDARANEPAPSTWRERSHALGPRRFARWLLLKRVGKSALRALDRLMARSSQVGNPERFDARTFPWVAELEAGWPAIRAELDTVLEDRARLPAFHEIQPD